MRYRVIEYKEGGFVAQVYLKDWTDLHRVRYSSLEDAKELIKNYVRPTYTVVHEEEG